MLLVLCTFHRNRTVFPIWRWFETSATILKSGVRKSEILAKLAPHGPKRAFCALFLEIELLSQFGDDLTVRRFWDLAWRKVRFCETLLRTAPNVRFVHFSQRTHCFPDLVMIWGHYDDFEILYEEKWDFAKTFSARPQTCVLCTLPRNRTVFPISWWFDVSTTILTSGVPKSDFLSKLAPRGPKSAFCALFLEIEPFSQFGDDLTSIRRFWHLVCRKVRFCQNLLRTAYNVRFVHFS